MQKSQVFMLPIKVKMFALPPFQPELQPLSLVVASHPPRPARLHTTHHCDQSLLYPVSFLDSPCLILLTRLARCQIDHRPLVLLAQLLSRLAHPPGQSYGVSLEILPQHSSFSQVLFHHRCIIQTEKSWSAVE